jgi:branched-chain amino acid transport system permease protein
MIRYVIAGLVVGGIYAMSASAIVLTYVSAGILNLAFGAIAYFVARLYYFLLVQHHWSILGSAAVSIFVVGPALGASLYFLLFRYLRHSSQLIKTVATIGLSVSLPPIAALLFGQPVILTAPGLAPQPVRVFNVIGVPITLDQVIAYGCVLVVLIGGTLILKATDVGLQVRAMVDSEAMTSLSGTNPSRIAVGVWVVSIFLAGLAGVLAAPIFSLADPNNFILLGAAALAAVVAARMRSLPIAVIVGFAMGIAGSLVQWALPPGSTFTADVVPSIPFVFMVVFLLYYTIRSGHVGERARIGGTLDAAIEPHRNTESFHQGLASAGVSRAATTSSGTKDRLLRAAKFGAAALARNPFVIVAAILPLLLPGLEAGMLGEAMAFSIAFLSYSLVTGEGGMISLCQITYAGVGALTVAQLAGVHDWPILPAILVGGLIAALMSTLICLLTLRMGDLYVALVTLTFGLLMYELVFQLNVFSQFNAGVTVPKSGFAASQTTFSYVTLGVFCVLSVLVYLVRRSTTGLVLGAIRSSDIGSRSVGINVMHMKLFVTALGGFVAGIAGAFLALYAGVALPSSYSPLLGLVWLAVLVTVGARSSNAAALAGLSFVYVGLVFSLNLPTSWGQVPTALFGLGAVMVAKNPDGIVALHARQLSKLKLPIRLHREPHDVPAAESEVASLGDGEIPTPVDVEVVG